MTASPVELFVIDVGEYAENPTITGIDDEVAALARWLDPFDVEVNRWDASTSERDRDAVVRRLTQWTNSPCRYSILYWVAHGQSNDSVTSLLCKESETAASGLLPVQVADQIAKRHKAPPGDIWSIVVIDACQSSAFVRALYNELEPKFWRQHILLVSTSDEGTATTLGRFSRALAEIFGGEYKEEVFEGQLSGQTVWLSALGGELLRKLDTRVFYLGVPEDAALQGDPLKILLRNLPTDSAALHARVQSADFGESQWFFEPRVEEAEIVDWLRRRTGKVFVVTGEPGVGKSALLGRVLLGSDPELAQALVERGLIAPRRRAELAPRRVFATHIRLTGETVEGFSRRLEHGLEKTKSRTPTVLVDALDEAQQPLAIARAIGEWAQRGIRFVVGTRASVRGQEVVRAVSVADQGAVEELVIGTDVEALGRYVRCRLLTAQEEGRISAEADTESTAKLILAKATSFLFANLAVHEVLAQPALLGPAKHDRLADVLDHGHDGLFAIAAKRLAATSPDYDALLKALDVAQGRGVPDAGGVLGTVAGAFGGGEALDDSTVLRFLTDKSVSPYVVADHEHDQNVYRFAHGDLRNPAAAAGGLDAAHRTVADALISLAAAHPSDINPYVTHHLAAHVAGAGAEAWEHLAREVGVLDRLDPGSVAVHALATLTQTDHLPPEVLGVIDSHNLMTGDLRDRAGLRQLGMARAAGWRSFSAKDPTWSWSVRSAVLRRRPAHLTLLCPSPVRAIATIAGEGTLLAAGCSDGGLLLWDTDEAELVIDHPPEAGRAGESCAVRTMCSYALDGRAYVAIVDNDGMGRIWDVAADKVVPCPEWRQAGVRAVAACQSAAGVVLTTIEQDGGIVLRDARSGALAEYASTARHAGLRVVAAYGTPSAPIVVAGGKDETIREWRLGADPDPEVLGRHRAWIAAVLSFRHGGSTWIASGDENGTVRTWRPGVAGGGVVVPDGARVRGMAVAIADERAYLASGHADGSVFVGTPTAEDQSLIRTGYADGIRAIAAWFAPGGTLRVATAGDDASLHVWNPGAAATLAQDQEYLEPVLAIAAHRTAGITRIVTAGRDGRVVAWDANTGKSLGVDANLGHPVRAMAASGDTPAIGTDEGLVIGGQAMCAAENPVCAVNAVSLAVHPVTREIVLVAGGNDGRSGVVTVRDPSTAVARSHFRIGSGPAIRGVAPFLAPDGQWRIAVGGHDKVIAITDLQGRGVDELVGHDDRALALCAWYQRGQAVVGSGSDDGTVRVWDVAAGRACRWIADHKHPVYAVAAYGGEYAPTGVLSGDSEGTVRLLALDDGRELCRIRVGAWVRSLCPIEGGVAIGTDDGHLVVNL